MIDLGVESLLNSNRHEASEVLSRGSGLSESLCFAACQLLRLVDDFQDAIRASPNESARELVKKNAFAAFASLYTYSGSGLRAFAPAAEVVAQSLGDIGRELIFGDGERVLDVARLALDIPKDYRTLLDYFSPLANVSGLPDVYELLAASLQPENAPCVGDLLLKIDVTRWLIGSPADAATRPSPQLVRAFLDVLPRCFKRSAEVETTLAALIQTASVDADAEQQAAAREIAERTRPVVHEIQKQHVAALAALGRAGLVIKLSTVLELLLQMSDEACVTAQAWLAYEEVLAEARRLAAGDAELSTRDSRARPEALQPDQAQMLLDQAGRFLEHVRRKRASIVPRWHPWLKPFGQVVEQLILAMQAASAFRGVPTLRILRLVFDPIVRSEEQPADSDETSDSAAPPWETQREQLEAAEWLLMQYVQLTACEENGNEQLLFEALWQWYLDNFAAKAPNHVLDVVHGVLGQLGWSVFKPSFAVLQVCGCKGPGGGGEHLREHLRGRPAPQQGYWEQASPFQFLLAMTATELTRILLASETLNPPPHLLFSQ
jgi:hypothetical protein